MFLDEKLCKLHLHSSHRLSDVLYSRTKKANYFANLVGRCTRTRIVNTDRGVAKHVQNLRVTARDDALEYGYKGYISDIFNKVLKCYFCHKIGFVIVRISFIGPLYRYVPDRECLSTMLSELSKTGARRLPIVFQN